MQCSTAAAAAAGAVHVAPRARRASCGRSRRVPAGAGSLSFGGRLSLGVGSGVCVGGPRLVCGGPSEVACLAGFGSKPKQGLRGDPNVRKANKNQGRPTVGEETGASAREVSIARGILNRLSDALGEEERVKHVRQMVADGVKAEIEQIDALGLTFFRIAAFYRNEAMDAKKLKDYNVLGFILEYAKAELGDKAKDWYSEGEAAPEFQLPEGMQGKV